MTYSKPEMKPRYENYIGGAWVAPVEGQYFTNHSPIDGSVIAEFPRSSAKDVAKAAKAAWEAAAGWGATSPAQRSNILLKVADRIEAHAQELMHVECWGNGKPLRECMFVDIPMAVDQIRYFAAAIRDFDRTTFRYVWTMGFAARPRLARDVRLIWSNDRSALYRVEP